MLVHKSIKIGTGRVEAYALQLGEKSLVLLRGTRGFIMCGYLNLSAAKRFKDAAIKITGVRTIADALNARVHSCTPRARRLGVCRGQPVKETLRLIV